MSEIETDQLRLRPFTAGDFQDYDHQITRDVEVMRMLPRKYDYCQDNAIGEGTAPLRAVAQSARRRRSLLRKL